MPPGAVRKVRPQAAPGKGQIARSTRGHLPQWKGCSFRPYLWAMRHAHPLSWALLLTATLGLLGADCSTRWKQRMYEGGGRDEWQQPDRVVETLGLAPDARVADVGSGSGYFTVRLARALGPEGRVFAIDVDPDINGLLEDRLAEEGIENVEVRLASETDPGLPENVDLVFTSNTYHHLPDRTAYFERVKDSLAPGGRVAIVEYSPETGGWFVRTFDHATAEAEITSEMEAAGYRLDASHDFLERQSFLVFSPAD